MEEEEEDLVEIHLEPVKTFNVHRGVKRLAISSDNLNRDHLDSIFKVSSGLNNMYND